MLTWECLCFDVEDGPRVGLALDLLIRLKNSRGIGLMRCSSWLSIYPPEDNTDAVRVFDSEYQVVRYRRQNVNDTWLIDLKTTKKSWIYLKIHLVNYNMGAGEGAGGGISRTGGSCHLDSMHSRTVSRPSTEVTVTARSR